MLTLIGREARRGGGVDALEHVRDREVDVVHRAERRVVERVEADGDALEPGGARGACAFCARSEPLVVSVRSSVGRAPAQHRDQLLDVAAQQRLAAGEADLLDAEAEEDAREARDLLEGEQLVRAAGTGSRVPNTSFGMQ